MNKEMPLNTDRGDIQQVLDLFKQAGHNQIEYNQSECNQAPSMGRRTFCTYTSLSFASLLLPACSRSDNQTTLKILSQETEFMQFFDIIFPADALGLNRYKAVALSRVQGITGEQAEEIMHMYQRFKGLLWLQSDLGTKAYSRAIGEKCMIDLLHSKYAEQYNTALDAIYFELSKQRKLIAALWGRPYSLTDKKCVYWDTYDQPVS